MPATLASAQALALLDRRRFFGDTTRGLGAMALASLLDADGRLEAAPTIDPARPAAPRAGHHPPRARNVIVVFCAGAFSQVDSFDYKPELIKRDGQPLPGNERLVTFQGENGNLKRPLWPFRPRGRCGKMVSDMVPHMGNQSDRICYLHSLTTKTNTHGPAENVMSTGFVPDGYPSIGAWSSYALGSDNQDLPSFVAIEDPRGNPQAGPTDWPCGFLPAQFQGPPFSTTTPVRYLQRPRGVTARTDLAARRALGQLNRRYAERFPGDTELVARLASYELAARMQLSVPRVTDLGSETQETLALYGANDPQNKIKAQFARNCILARRLVEQGVRFVQLFNGAYASGGRLNWDGHNKLKPQYDHHSEILDQPVAGLLIDLARRGMLEDTLLVFCTEFGRLPMFQRGTLGRDHIPRGFTCWLAGAGVKAPFSFGATDDFSFRAAENVLTVHDFHATILHLLGLDHRRLTYYHNGLQRRLTDVHGHVIQDILA